MLNKTNSSAAFHFMLEIQILNFHFVGIFFLLILVQQALDSLFDASSTVSFSAHRAKLTQEVPS